MATAPHQQPYLLSSTIGDADVVEICGREARASEAAMRRHLKSGLDCDLTADAGPDDPEQLASVFRYFDGADRWVL